MMLKLCESEQATCLHVASSCILISSVVLHNAVRLYLGCSTPQQHFLVRYAKKAAFTWLSTDCNLIYPNSGILSARQIAASKCV